MTKIEELIAGLTILHEYEDKWSGFDCEHDVLYVQINPNNVPEDVRARLEELGFNADLDDLENFYIFA